MLEDLKIPAEWIHEAKVPNAFILTAIIES